MTHSGSSSTDPEPRGVRDPADTLAASGRTCAELQARIDSQASVIHDLQHEVATLRHELELRDRLDAERNRFLLHPNAA